MSKFDDIGQSIMNDIIEADLIGAAAEDVVVWKANSAEVLEAILAKYCHEMHTRILKNMEVL